MSAAGTVSLILLICMIVVPVVLIYSSWRYLNYVESLMRQSEWVLANQQNYARAGLPGKVIRLCSIALMLCHSNFFIRRGLANPDDVKNFPQHIRGALIFLLFSMYFVAVAIVVFNFVWPPTSVK